MKKKARIGAVLTIEVRDKSGKIKHAEEIHNILGNGMLNEWNQISTAGLFYLQTTTLRTVFSSSTWSASAGALTRTTGTDTLSSISNELMSFGSGERSYAASGSGTSATLVSPLTLGPTTLIVYHTSTRDNISNVPSGYTWVVTSPIFTQAYSNGVYTHTMNNGPFSTNPTTGSFTLARITLRYTTNAGNIRFSHFDLAASVGIVPGDVITISSLVLTFNFSDYQPIAFAVSPITGLTGSGHFQYLRRILSEVATAPSRIYLISDANKITPIPDLLSYTGGSVINPASITAIETMTATGSSINASASNDGMKSHSITGVTAVGGTVKQIAWGIPSELYGIIEYDTPVSIASAKALTVGMSQHMVIDIP
jgi:hypothetical protein